MFDVGAVLRDDQVICKRWIVRAVALELIAAIKSLGRRRSDFDDDFGVDDYIAILIEELKLSAHDQEIRIGVEPFLRVTTPRQRPTSDSHILCESLTARAFQLRAYFSGQICADRSVLRAFARHRIYLTVQIFVALFGFALNVEVLVFGVA